jgi:hypothetical protein
MAVKDNQPPLAAQGVQASRGLLLGSIANTISFEGESAMAESRRSIGWVVLLLLLAVLLIALNPTMEDFQAWRAADARSSAVSKNSTGIARALEEGAGAIAGAMVGVASGAFERTNYFIFSTYSSGGSKGPLYVGIARMFIRVR